MQPLLNQRRQQIRYTFPALLARPKADEPWIRQVMVNLVHNASKHTNEGGLVIISVTQDDEQVVVTVTDNGKGLIGTGREELFKEFFQEQPNSTSGQDGFGLGLTIVRSVIESHGGKVYIGSSPNLGTMVSFTLPAEAPV
jgi:signal transduction histidine kinase